MRPLVGIHSSPGGSGVDDDDLLVLLLLGTVAGPAILAVAWTSIVDWLLEVHVLVDTVQRPLLVLPASGGAGLDLPRLLLLAAFVLGVFALLGSVLTRAVRSRRADVAR